MRSVPSLPKFSCHRICERRSNDGSVKVLLAASGCLFRLNRLGLYLAACAISAFAACKKNQPIDEANRTVYGKPSGVLGFRALPQSAFQRGREDKGHYFDTDLPDSDKRALIEYLKML